MKTFIYYDDNGNIVEIVKTNLDEVDQKNGLDSLIIEDNSLSNSISIGEFFVNKSKIIVRKPSRPTNFHFWQDYSWQLSREFLKSKINTLVNLKRENDLSMTVVFDGLVFDADKTAITNIQSTLIIFQPSGQLPENFGWRTHDNQTVPMTYAKLEGLAQAIYARNAQIYAESWALKDSLNSKTDDELLAIYESLAQSPG